MKENSLRKSKRRAPSRSGKEEGREVGFSMYGPKGRSTAGRKRSPKKRKRWKTRKERNALLRVSKRNRAKRARRAVETPGGFDELRPECELRPQGEREMKRTRDRMRERQPDEHKHKQAELGCKRQKHKDRKRDTKSSRPQQQLNPNRHSFRPPKGTHVEGLDSCCYGNERTGSWKEEMGMNQGTEYGIHKEKKRKSNRHGKKTEPSKRDSKADCFVGQVRYFPSY